MATDPITQWTIAAWDGLVSKDDMRCSWKQAMINVAGASRPFGQVCGPAGAMVASAVRIGWKVPSPFHFIMGCGTLLNLHDIAPRDVQLLANRSLMHLEAVSSSLAARIGGPPDLEPLRSFLHSIGRTKAAASLRSLGEGGWWTQSRMYEAGMPGVSDDICKACHKQRGTLYHRCCECEASAGLRMRTSKHRGILDLGPVCSTWRRASLPAWSAVAPEANQAPTFCRQVVWGSGG